MEKMTRKVSKKIFLFKNLATDNTEVTEIEFKELTKNAATSTKTAFCAGETAQWA
jgi:hypothetical protein